MKRRKEKSIKNKRKFMILFFIVDLMFDDL